MKKTIGILGGMGPEATSYFFDLIIKHTMAEKDQDHIPVVIYSHPEVPPRTEAILKSGPSPVPYLVEGVRCLLEAGADFVVIPCVTAHYFIPEVRKQIDFPFLDLIEETAKRARSELPSLKKAGLIASTGTIRAGLFHIPFSAVRIEVISPSDEEQELVMEAIFGDVKAGILSGRSKETIARTAESLIGKGAEAIIAGCTEVPLVLKDEDISVPLIEPLRILARRSIEEAGYPLKG